MHDAIINTGKSNSRKQILVVAAAWFAINLIHAAYMPVDADEAYYWFYSLKMDWGYFDHPPMAAIFIKAGELLGHGPFFTRLIFVVLGAATVILTYNLIPAGIKDLRLFGILFFSVSLFHIYSFVATPDSPLLFFTALFFYAYKRFLEKDSVKQTLLLAVSIAGLLYSKYHGVLPVFFTFLSNPRLALKRSAWFAFFIAIVMLLPHIYWQYLHDWPTVRYHLSERIGSAYRISKTTNYLLVPLFVFGFLTSIPVYWWMIKKRPASLYLRAHYFNFCGVLLFFFLSSFRSTIEAHWVLVAAVSFVVVAYETVLRVSQAQQKLLINLGKINIALLLILHVVILFPNPVINKVGGARAIVYGRSWADGVYSYAQNNPVVFAGGYQAASLYLYYHPGLKAYAYSTVFDRKTQYTISPIEDSLHNKKVIVALRGRINDGVDSLKNIYRDIYFITLDSFQATHHLKIECHESFQKLAPGEKKLIKIKLSNTGNQAFTPRGNLYISSIIYKTRRENYPGERIPVTEKTLEWGFNKEFLLPVEMPVRPGNYKLMFSIEQPPLSGTFASGFYPVRVN
jgi:hypothetical protein